MRNVVVAFAMLTLTVQAQAQVRLAVGKDGKKVIYNVGGSAGSDFSWLARQHNRASRFDELIERYASRYSVDPVLVRAVIQVESDFNPGCVSRKGARGLMQLMPETARRYGVARMHDPEQNIRGGVQYLRDLLSMFPNDLPRALAAYNAGENAVARYGGIPPFEETMTYVRRAMTVYSGHPYGEATSFPGSPQGAKLRGGFALAQPLALTLIPGMRYLGSQ
jgi:soluble lytic murein transglycosylase-like protein